MAGGYQVGIASETKAFKQGIDSGVIDPLEDAQKALTETGKNKGLDKLEDGLKDAQRATERLADETKDTARAIEREYRDSYRKVKQSADDGLDGMKHATEEATGELKQNLGETFSSFRGDLEDLPQIAQDVFGGLAGSVGSLTASLGLAAGAAGVGLLVAGFQQLQKEEEDRQQSIADWTAAYIDGLSTMSDAVADFAKVEAIYTDKDRYAEAVKNAKNWGTSVSEAVNAMSGDMTSLGVVQENLASRADTVSAALDAVGGDVRGLNHDMRELRDETSQGQDAYDKLTGVMSEAQSRAEQYSASLISLVQNSQSATHEVDAVGNAVYTLPDGKQVLIDAQTGKATADLSKFKGDADGVIDQLNGRDVTLSLNAAIWEAQQKVNQFMSDNDGKSFTMYGRVKVDQGGDWQ